jgi:hypothetical protein
MIVKEIIYTPLNTLIVLQTSAPVPQRWNFSDSTYNAFSKYARSVAVRDLETGTVYPMLEENDTDYLKRTNHPRGSSMEIYTEVVIFPPFETRRFSLFHQRQPKAGLRDIYNGLSPFFGSELARWDDIEEIVVR